MIKKCNREDCHITYETTWQGPPYHKEREVLEVSKKKKARITIPKQRVFATMEQEEELKQVLLNAGYPIEDIDIKVDGVRVGYWNRVNQAIFDDMNKIIEMDPWDAFDEDTGDKWFYAYDQEPSTPVIPMCEIKVTDDNFILFLNYLYLKRNFTTLGIIHVVEKPHKYKQYLEDYNKENVE